MKTHEGNYARGGRHHGYYRDEAAMRRLACSEGGRLAVRKDLLEQQFHELLTPLRLPADIRCRIAQAYTEDGFRLVKDTTPTRRQVLLAEQERVNFQH